MRAASIDASASATSASGWQSAATFVVAFEERGRGDALERRIVAELTEVEPEASPHQRSQWPGWACGDACQWMLERVAGPAVPAAPAVPGPVEAASPPVKTVTGPARGAEALPAIEIERAHLADAVGSTELVAGSRPVPQDRLVWVQPARLFVTLGSGASGPGACVVLQLIQLGGRKQRIEGQLDDTGRVTEVEVSGLADGEYTPSIVAWTPDGSSLPRVVKLPTVAVSGQPTAHGGPP